MQDFFITLRQIQALLESPLLVQWSGKGDMPEAIILREALTAAGILWADHLSARLQSTGESLLFTADRRMLVLLEGAKKEADELGLQNLAILADAARVAWVDYNAQSEAYMQVKGQAEADAVIKQLADILKKLRSGNSVT